VTTFPGSPRLLKGALVSFDLPSPTPSVIVFQYNPDTLTRTLQAQTAGERTSVPRFKGAPVETISLEVEIDATDQLEKADGTATEMGIHPELAALEVLLYPQSSRVLDNISLLEMGIIEVVPPPAPFTLFIYGPRRILPVQVTEFRATEEAHDVQLNPIRARVSLGLRVLSYNDLLPGHPGHALFIAHQIGKEAMARMGVVTSPDATGVNRIL
jgi:hypothetical protein